MKTYLLKDFNIENFETINEFLDDLENNHKEWQIYINSWGWSVRVRDSILTRLEELKVKWINIKLRAIFIYSCAFDLFFKYSGNKVLEEWVDWGIHVIATEVHTFRKDWQLRIRTDDTTVRERFYGQDEVEWYDFLTTEEKKLFFEWKDIYLSSKRLNLIFNTN